MSRPGSPLPSSPNFSSQLQTIEPISPLPINSSPLNQLSTAIPPPLLSSVLKKRSPSSPSIWQSRTFSLYPEFLLYTIANPISSTAALGFLPLPSIIYVTPIPSEPLRFDFLVQSVSNLYTFQLQCGSGSECLVWVDMLSRVTREGRGGRGERERWWNNEGKFWKNTGELTWRWLEKQKEKENPISNSITRGGAQHHQNKTSISNNNIQPSSVPNPPYISPTLLTGTLNKRSPALHHSYQSRIFTLTPTLLTYAKPSSVHVVAGSVLVKSMRSIEKIGECGFCIVTWDEEKEKEKKIVLTAIDEKQRDEWLTVLRAALQRYRDEQQQQQQQQQPQQQHTQQQLNNHSPSFSARPSISMPSPSFHSSSLQRRQTAPVGIPLSPRSTAYSPSKQIIPIPRPLLFSGIFVSSIDWSKETNTISLIERVLLYDEAAHALLLQSLEGKIVHTISLFTISKVINGKEGNIFSHPSLAQTSALLCFSVQTSHIQLNLIGKNEYDVCTAQEEIRNLVDGNSFDLNSSSAESNKNKMPLFPLPPSPIPNMKHRGSIGSSLNVPALSLQNKGTLNNYRSPVHLSPSPGPQYRKVSPSISHIPEAPSPPPIITATPLPPPLFQTLVRAETTYAPPMAPPLAFTTRNFSEETPPIVPSTAPSMASTMTTPVAPPLLSPSYQPLLTSMAPPVAPPMAPPISPSTQSDIPSPPSPPSPPSAQGPFANAIAAAAARRNSHSAISSSYQPPPAAALLVSKSSSPAPPSNSSSDPPPVAPFSESLPLSPPSPPSSSPTNGGSNSFTNAIAAAAAKKKTKLETARKFNPPKPDPLTSTSLLSAPATIPISLEEQDNQPFESSNPMMAEIAAAAKRRMSKPNISQISPSISPTQQAPSFEIIPTILTVSSPGILKRSITAPSKAHERIALHTISSTIVVPPSSSPSPVINCIPHPPIFSLKSTIASKLNTPYSPSFTHSSPSFTPPAPPLAPSSTSISPAPSSKVSWAKGSTPVNLSVKIPATPLSPLLTNSSPSSSASPVVKQSPSLSTSPILNSKKLPISTQAGTDLPSTGNSDVPAWKAKLLADKAAAAAAAEAARLAEELARRPKSQDPSLPAWKRKILEAKEAQAAAAASTAVTSVSEEKVLPLERKFGKLAAK